MKDGIARTPTLRAITIWPEWLFAIIHLGKDIENRGPRWDQRSLIGQWIALHGGKHIGGIPPRSNGTFHESTRDAVHDMLDMEKFARGDGEKPARLEFTLTIGDILDDARGVAALAKIDAIWRGGPARGWFVGEPEIGLHFERVVRLQKPIPCLGQQGLWPVPRELVQQAVRLLPVDAPSELARLLGEAS